MKPKFRCSLARQGDLSAIALATEEALPPSRSRFGGTRRRSLAGGIVIALVLASGTPALARIKKSNTITRDPYVGAMVIDADSGQILVSDNPDAKAYPASVLKLMNLLIILDKIQAGNITLQDKVLITAEAAKIGGSQVYLKENETFTIDELLYALIVQSANDAATALARGRLAHALLERLPGLPPADRRAAADIIIAGDPGIEAGERAAIIEEAFAVLDDPDLAALFGPQSRAEVAIAGNLATSAGAFAVSGRIDRMAITGEAVLVADFKTNRLVPARPEDADPAYILQMALYRRLLAESVAARPVRALLIWTVGPQIMVVPDALMDAALAGRGLGDAFPVTGA